MRDGGLAAAGRADNADGLAGSGLEGDAGQRRTLTGALVAEIDGVEAQYPVGDDQVLGVRRILDINFEIEQFEQPSAARRGTANELTIKPSWRTGTAGWS